MSLNLLKKIDFLNINCRIFYEFWVIFNMIYYKYVLVVIHYYYIMYDNSWFVVMIMNVIICNIIKLIYYFGIVYYV